ncbi:MAG: TetR/AcrR family transcriptional regulator [Deltaproteobacteria bacterium]|nr:TetR/AcrR family transcriptional regulator [Deltaproteobacteria bacterium]
MARPVNADAEATRRKVLGAASLLFAEHGVDGVSVRDVARDAGVSLGLVHHYFGSKDALYQAAIAAMYAELDPLRAEFDRALAEGGDLAALIERVVRAGFGFACAHRSEIKLMMRTVVDTGEVDARWREAQQLPFLEQTSALLAPAGASRRRAAPRHPEPEPPGDSLRPHGAARASAGRR